MKVMSATINGAVDMIRYTLILRKVKKFGLHANVTMDTIGAGQKKMSSFLLLRNNMDVFDICTNCVVTSLHSVSKILALKCKVVSDGF